MSRVKRVDGSGIEKGVFVFSMLRRRKMSWRLTVLSWFASPRIEDVPKCWMARSRSCWLICPSSFVSPSSGAWVVIRPMSLPSPAR